MFLFPRSLSKEQNIKRFITRVCQNSSELHHDAELHKTEKNTFIYLKLLKIESDMRMLQRYGDLTADNPL